MMGTLFCLELKRATPSLGDFGAVHESSLECGKFERLGFGRRRWTLNAGRRCGSGRCLTRDQRLDGCAGIERDDCDNSRHRREDQCGELLASAVSQLHWLHGIARAASGDWRMASGDDAESSYGQLKPPNPVSIQPCAHGTGVKSLPPPAISRWRVAARGALLQPDDGNILLHDNASQTAVLLTDFVNNATALKVKLVPLETLASP